MPADIVTREARPEEAGEISALALRSKSHWGYDKAFLEACRAGLRVTEEDCASGAVKVAVDDSGILGFYRLDGVPPHGELSDLFVDLRAIGGGVGRRLLEAALREAADRGFADLVLDADPGAEPFYERFGAVRIGASPSTAAAGRMLPRMRFDLAAPGVGEVVVRTCRAEDVDILTAAEPHGANIASRCFARQERGESVLLVAWRGGDPVGTGELLRGEVPEVRSLHVRHDRRGRGYGTAMLDEAERLARAWGATSLRLGVGLDNTAARRLYERLGFTGTGEVATTTYTYVDAEGPHEATETAETLVKPVH